MHVPNAVAKKRLLDALRVETHVAKASAGDAVRADGGGAARSAASAAQHGQSCTGSSPAETRTTL